MHDPVQECACRHDDRGSGDLLAVLQKNACGVTALYQEPLRAADDPVDIRLTLERSGGDTLLIEGAADGTMKIIAGDPDVARR